MLSAWPNGNGDAGLSLVEVTVALAILAFVAAVSLPRAPDLLARGQRSIARDQVELQLRDLGRRASREGHMIELAALPETGERDAIRLPAGWRLDAKPPVRYRLDGVCSGGTVTITAPGAPAMTYTLAPPFCRPVRR